MGERKAVPEVTLGCQSLGHGFASTEVGARALAAEKERGSVPD
jgi:hypothetical protein